LLSTTASEAERGRTVMVSGAEPSAQS